MAARIVIRSELFREKLSRSDYQIFACTPLVTTVGCYIRNIGDGQVHYVNPALPWEEVSRITYFLKTSNGSYQLPVRLSNLVIQACIDQALIPHPYDEYV